MVLYEPGKNNILADALFRHPDYDHRRDIGRQPGSADDEQNYIGLFCARLELHAIVLTHVLSVRNQIAESYTNASTNYLRYPCEGSLTKLKKLTRDIITRVVIGGSLLTYTIDVFDPPRVVIPTNDDLRARLMHEFHDTPDGGIGAVQFSSRACTSTSRNGYALVKCASL